MTRIVILGAGGVGIAAALCLQQRGCQTVVIDRKLPASETSGGNAGIVSDSSAVPLNNPTLRSNLGELLLDRGAALRLHAPTVLTHLPWLWQFWRHSAPAASLRRARILFPLVARSKQLHEQWLTECGLPDFPCKSGWMKCYRQQNSFDAAAPERKLWDEVGVRYQTLSAREIEPLAPGVNPVFVRAVHLPETFSIPNPQRAVREYAKWLADSGGQFLQTEVAAIRQVKPGWEVLSADGNIITQADVAVVALGPWSGRFLKQLHLRLPMALERGGHRNFAADNTELPVAIADVDGGYIAVRQESAVRMTSGVYFAKHNAPPPNTQLRLAEATLRQTVRNLGAQTGEDWFGARPSLPDCLPAIGSTRLPGLYLATGHQHIGFATAPASGELLADLIQNQTPRVPAEGFAPSRFGL